MECENESSVISSPSQSDLDEFYSLPSSPVISSSDVPGSPSESLKSSRVSNSSCSSLHLPTGTLPQVEGGKSFGWKHAHQIDLDNSHFYQMRNCIIDKLKMTFIFYIDEAFPFTTSQIWFPFCQATNMTMTNPAVGNIIYYDTDPEYFPEPPSQSVGSFDGPGGTTPLDSLPTLTGIRNAILKNVHLVYTAKNSCDLNRGFEYEKIMIVAPFYQSRDIVLTNPVIQLITVIKDGGKRHCCLPEKITAPPNVICAPFFKAENLNINDASFIQTDHARTLFSCPCLLSSISCFSFAEAYNSNLDTPSFYKLEKKLKEPKKHTNLLKLLQCSLTDVELDSTLRWPFPRCHGGTRSFLKQKIITWLVDDHRKQQAFWLHGDAGTGKSAVAQTVGDYANKRGVLGAAAFVSRSKKLNDPNRIITSISLQLAQRNEAYERIVTKVIQDNPSILNITADKRAQFKELILKPFSLLKKGLEDQKKTLIILDGLDEIDGKVAQSDLISVIGEVLHPSYNSPFIWLLCSRPERHLQDTFRPYTTQTLYQTIITSPEADDTHKDVERFYLEELHRLKGEYRSCFTPDTNQLGETAYFLDHVRSSSFLYVSTLVRFIGSPNISNPASQLDSMVDLMERPLLVSRSGNNYSPIDMLYLYILQTIPQTDQVQVLPLLGVLTVSRPIPALYLAAMFCIPKVTLYSILRPLCPVLLVPAEFPSQPEAMRFYHVSFPDFLTNSDYSRKFFQDPDTSRAQLAKAQLRAIAGPVNLHFNSRGWYPHNPLIFGSAIIRMPSYDILIHAAKTTWDICSQISHPVASHQQLYNTLISFNFQRLQDVSEAIPTYSFMNFLWWLQESVQETQELQDIVRTSPKSDIDIRFVSACEQCHRSRRRQFIASPFPWCRDDMDEILKDSRYALAGFGDQAVLILLTPEVVMIFTAEDIDDL